MKKNKITYIIRCTASFLIALCTVCGSMPVPAFAQETDHTTQYSSSEHVLREENNWDISDELIMPGEVFYTEPKYEFSYEKLQSGTTRLTAWPRYLHATLTLNKPDGEEGGEARWYTDALVRSTPDTSKVVPGKTNSYNVIKMAYDKGDLSSLQSDDTCRDALQGAIKGEKQVTAGYRNDTGLPMVLEQVRGSSTIDEGLVYGGEFGMDLLVDAWSTHNWGCTIRFYEPYYNLSYELYGMDGEFTEEEKKVLPDRYYIQREKQELVLPNPIRPGYHFEGWFGGLVGVSDVSQKDGNTILSFDWEHNLKDAGFSGAGDQTLSAQFEQGLTVTFNPNGGQLKEGDPAIREIDTTDYEVNQFFDINECVPVREEYRFVGWCTSPSASDASLIKNTRNSDWIVDWAKDTYNRLQIDSYDIQLYAKWAKEDPCAKGHTPQETLTQATAESDGRIVTKCSVCGKTLSETVIKRASDICLSDTSYTYDGKEKTPQLVVKDSEGKQLNLNTDYTVTYAKDRKNVGCYDVTITFAGNYNGTVNRTFTIEPKQVNLSKVKAGRKKITVKWKKQAVQTTGYEIQYGTSSGFEGAKTVTVSKNKTTGKTISKLKAKKKYYVRIRAYKTVKVKEQSVKIYSSWSKVRKIKVK